MKNDHQQESCIISCRVSTKKQSQEGESLDVQLNICRGIADSRGWKIDREWALDYSGRTDTVVFEEQLKYIDSNPGKISFYLFRAIDRFTRKGSYDYELMRRELEKRGVKMVDSYGVIQPTINSLEDVGFEYEWSKVRPSEISEVVMATTTKQEVTTILTRLIGQEIRLTQRGYKIRAPQDGYVNKRVYVEGKKRTIQVRDPERARFIEEIFILRASGMCTDAEITDRLNAMGYRTPLFQKWNRNHAAVIGQGGGNKLTIKRLQEIVKRPIYAGVVVEKWTKYKPVRTPYEGLVSIDTFNRANRGKVYIKEQSGDGKLEMLYDYHPERKVQRLTRYNKEFVHKNVILCPLCQKPFLGSYSRSKSGKRIPYYHCARKHKRVGIPRDQFDSIVEKFIRSLKFRPEALASMNAVFLDRYRERQSELMDEASNIGHVVAELEARKAQAVRSYISATSDSLKREIEKEINAIETDIINSQSVRNTLELQEKDIDRFVRRVRHIMEHPCELLLNPEDMRQQEALFGLVFTKLPTYEEIRDGTPEMAWVFDISATKTESDLLVRPPGLEPGTISLKGSRSTN